jgi:hypothetical protein
MEIKYLKIFGLGLMLLFVVSCGGLQANAPEIRIFAFVSQDTNRPYIFYFRVEWRDAEGDLIELNNPGQLLFTIEEPDKPHIPPKDVPFSLKIGRIEPGPILNEDLIPGAKEGKLIQIPIELRADPGSYPKRIKITATLVDSKGNRSNRPWVIIQSDE